MGSRLTTRRSLLATALGLGLVFGVQAADIGPLPTIKVNAAKAELGKRLFFDKRLSGDAGIACADCHMPEHGYGSKEALSPGYPGNGHFRNAPTLINTAAKGKLGIPWLHDGRLGTNLNDLTREMLTEDYIMNMDMRIMQERVKQDPKYLEMFKTAGYGEPSNGSVRKAIPEYLNSLTSENVPFDSGRMSAAAKKGMELFKGKAGCIRCHNGALASDQDYHNIGIPPDKRWEEDALAQITFRFENYAKGQTEEGYRSAKSDWGFCFRGKNKWDRGKFRTPSLRYTKYSASYMHNGVFYTLEEVVDFYNSGGFDEEGRTTLFPENKSALIKPLGLSDEEKEDLLAFLDAFSGEEILMDNPKLPEYAPLFTLAELKKAQEDK